MIQIEPVRTGPMIGTYAVSQDGKIIACFYSEIHAKLFSNAIQNIPSPSVCVC